MQGHVTFNGQELIKRLKRQVGYVLQVKKPMPGQPLQLLLPTAFAEQCLCSEATNAELIFKDQYGLTLGLGH